MKIFLFKLILFSSMITNGRQYCPTFGIADSMKYDSVSHWNHRYDQTLVMKLFLSKPDANGKSKVALNFENALSIIKTTDHLSLNVPKIIYLVGWQYNGHDDKYPAFFEVNPALKRPQDETATESLIWLMTEAKKYHTTVSLHINMTDAYDDSPLWNEYVLNDLISKNADGSLKEIGNYNGRKAYQINYRNEWEKGFAQKRIDKLIELLPSLKDAGTIHIDAWIARASEGHQESLETERDFQKKIARYWIEKGIDPTSEWVMGYMQGIIPYYWHFNHRTQEDYLSVPASLCTGSHMNPDVKRSDFGLEFLFGTSMYGENIFPSANTMDSENWRSLFMRDFYLNCVQYFYLNQLQRINVEGEGNERVAFFSDDVNVSLLDSTVIKTDRILRDKSFIQFPIVWKKEKNMVLYSVLSQERMLQIPKCWGKVKHISIFQITGSGELFLEKVKVKNDRLTYLLKGNVPYLIKPHYQ